MWQIIDEADEEVYGKLTALVSGESFPAYIDTGVIYPQIKANPSTIYSFLLVAGYLKATKTTSSFVGGFMCEVSLPNKEISFVYNFMMPQEKTFIMDLCLVYVSC